jgi:hypothetical protein
MSTDLLTLNGYRDRDDYADPRYRNLSCDLTVTRYCGDIYDGPMIQLTLSQMHSRHTQLTRYQIKQLHKTLGEFLEDTK